MPKRTQNPSEIDALRVRIEELTHEVARLTLLLRERPLQPSEPPPPDWWAPLPMPVVSWWELQPRDWRPLFGDRPDDVKGASAPLTYGD